MEALRARIEVAISGEVTDLAPLTGGACQESFRVDAVVDGEVQTLALRSDARSSLPGSVSRAVEYPVIAAAVGAGVPTPRARWLTHGLVRDDAYAYFMDWVDGEAIGARIVRHPKLAAAREALPNQLARAMAAVHRVTPESHAELPLPDRDVSPVVAAFGSVRAMLDDLPDPRPALELAFRWCREHAPEIPETTLLHGDFRTGNFLVGASGLNALLDWEFTRWGDPLEDLAWFCMRDWRFGVVQKAAGGITTRADFYRRYAELSGREVDPARVHYWEVLGNIRWGGCAVMQGERYLSGTSADLEMLAIPRRVAEMEWEALRLIETGPGDPS
jgi:aminoglycoside phosphotransferase (APT) family kinase protein